ncbi:hypothetical protein ACFL0D_04340 [Thermoproteota archaeon]
MSEEEKLKELVERLQRLAIKEKEVEARMKKVEKALRNRKTR